MAVTLPECCPTLQPQPAARHMNHRPAILGPGKATTSAFTSKGPAQPPPCPAPERGLCFYVKNSSLAGMGTNLPWDKLTPREQSSSWESGRRPLSASRARAGLSEKG